MTDAIERLYQAVQNVRAEEQSSSSPSRTAKLLREGLPKMAKKVAEEAMEVGLDAVQGDRTKIIAESADLMYNLVVLWTEIGIMPGEVWAEMDRREDMLGIAEKLPKSGRSE